MNPRQIVTDAGKELLRRGLVEGTWGNCSLRIDDRTMAITPSGRRYEDMTPDDIVIVNYRTMEARGRLKPSSEKRLHREIYNTRREIRAVIHTHQPWASALAAAGKALPPVLDDQAQILGPSVRCAAYALPNTRKIVRATLKALRGRFAAFMANHGAITAGRSMDEALTAAMVLEKASKAYIRAEFIGGAKRIGYPEAWAMHQVYLWLYSKKQRQQK